MKLSIQIIAIFISLWVGNNLFGQNNGVTIGGSETRSDAVLWLIPSGNDGQQGLVLPETQKDGFTPTIAGMVIFDPSDQTIYLWNGSAWESLGGGTGTADDWGSQTVVSESVLTGAGTTLDPLTLASQDAGIGQVLKWNGTSWAPALDATGETGASVNSINEITGDGTEGSPLQLSSQGAVVGQILKWDGTAWTPAEDLSGGSGETYSAGDGILIDTDNSIINLGDADADPSNEIQTLSFDVVTNELSLSDGNTISIPTGGTDADADPTNEIQDLTLVGTLLNISDGAGVDLAAIIPPGGTDDQNLIVVGDELSIEGGTGSVDLSNYINDADSDPTNEIQSLSFNAGTNVLSLTNGGTVTIPTGGSDADADPTNELQTISYNGLTGEVSLTDGGSFSLTTSDFGAFRSQGGVVRPIDINEDDFVFGSYQIDDLPGTIDDNTRMIFDKSKGAFRAGSSIASWSGVDVGNYSTAFGFECQATSGQSIAAGYYSEATNFTALAIGDNTLASGVASSSFGVETQAESYGTMAIGRFNVGGGNATTWVGTNKLFEIGNGSNDGNRTNALTVLKNGNLGIDESAPTSKLVVGRNFNFSIPGTDVITVGGASGAGGSIFVGNNHKYFKFRNDAFVTELSSYDDSYGNGKGNFKIDARTLQLGDAELGNAYMLDIDQNAFYGVHQTNGDYGWEHVVSSSSGTLQLYTDNSLISAIGSFDYTSGAYSSLSDRNSKEDVKSLDSVMDKVNALEPLSYKFVGAKNNKNSLGFIAQDVQEIFPEIVTFVEGREGSEGRHLMDYSGFGVIAIAAIQEQQEEIEDLKNTIEALLKRVENLENK